MHQYLALGVDLSGVSDFVTAGWTALVGLLGNLGVTL
jgi:hypothetical protein